MGSYLLKADDADLDRWKADALAAGISFAEHIRQRLEAGSYLHLTDEQEARYQVGADRQQMTLHDWIIDTLDYASDPESGADILLQRGLI